MAVLNANYLGHRFKDHYNLQKIQYSNMNLFSKLKDELSELTTLDVAKVTWLWISSTNSLFPL